MPSKKDLAAQVATMSSDPAYSAGLFTQLLESSLSEEAQGIVKRAITPERTKQLLELILAEQAAVFEQMTAKELQQVIDFLSSPAGAAYRKVAAEINDKASAMGAKYVPLVMGWLAETVGLRDLPTA